MSVNEKKNARASSDEYSLAPSHYLGPIFTITSLKAQRLITSL